MSEKVTCDECGKDIIESPSGLDYCGGCYKYPNCCDCNDEKGDQRIIGQITLFNGNTLEISPKTWNDKKLKKA